VAVGVGDTEVEVECAEQNTASVFGVCGVVLSDIDQGEVRAEANGSTMQKSLGLSSLAQGFSQCGLCGIGNNRVSTTVLLQA